MKFLIITVFLIIALIPISANAQNQIESLSKEELNKIGLELINEQKYLEAIEYFDKILEIDPHDKLALTNKGATLTKLGNHEKALEYFNKALEIDPQNIEILSNKGATLASLGKMNEALKITDKILAIEPNNVKILIAKASIFSNLERFTDAKNTYERILKIEPSNRFALDYLNENITSQEFIPMRTSKKFLGHVQVEVRNSQGNLVSVTESDTMNYLPYYITDEYLDESQINKIVNINGINYEERKFQETYHAKYDDVFIGKITMGTDKIGFFVNLFESYPHGFTIEYGDVAVAHWTILRQVT